MYIISLLFYWMLLLNVSNLKFFIDRIRFWIIFYKIDVYLCCALCLSYRRLLHLRCALHLLKLCPSLKKNGKFRRPKNVEGKKNIEIKNIVLTWSCEQSKFGVSSMCWRSLPGVQTKMFSSFTCSFSMPTSLRPPISRPALKEWYFPTDFNTSKSWPVNSLVGDIMMLPTPSSGPHLNLYNFSRT